jgi:NADH dehydrogenase
MRARSGCSRAASIGPDAIPYDTLIVAAGSQYNYFRHDEWQEIAPNVKTIEGALTLRRRILAAFEAAELEREQARRNTALTFVIVGAGPTGVEMAGQIAETARDIGADFRSVKPSHARILLVEAGDRVLSGFPRSLSTKAMRSLEHLGVTTLLNHVVTNLDARSITLRDHRGSSETIPARTIIWAAGVVASPLAHVLGERTGLGTDRAGRVEVGEDLSLPAPRYL